MYILLNQSTHIMLECAHLLEHATYFLQTFFRRSSAHNAAWYTLPFSINPSLPLPPSRPKKPFLSSYSSRLKLVAALAMVATAFHHTTRFLGFCALTWATVVLLGGFVGQLKKQDFYVVTVMLLLEAFRFAAAIFFSTLVLKKLVSLSSKPLQLQYHDWQRRLLVSLTKFVAQAWQLLVISPSIALPLLALTSIDYDKGDSPFQTLNTSLRLFYILVTFNACLAAIAVLYSIAVTLFLARLSRHGSLQRYFDEIVWRGINQSLLEANEFDFLEFAFKIQKEEYSRNVQPVVVRKMYGDLMNYLLQHKKGIETSRMFLDDGDSYMQEAAANLIGLFAEFDTEGKLRQHKQLLKKLAQKVDNDQIGWAATNSLHQLASKYPKDILLLCNEQNERLVNVLIENISAEATGRSIVYMRTLEAILEGTNSTDHSTIDVEYLNTLKRELTEIITRERSKLRAKVMAGACLQALNSYDSTVLSGRIIKTPISRKEYILQKEWEKLTGLVGIVDKPLHWQNLEIRDPHDPGKIENLPRHVILICSLVILIMLMLIASVIVLLVHYGKGLTS